VQFNVWSDEWVGKGDWLETLADLRQEGELRFFVSITDHQPENALELIGSGAVDSLQVILNAWCWITPPCPRSSPACAACARSSATARRATGAA